MNLCECGCGGAPSPGKRYIKHHQWRKKREVPTVVVVPRTFTQADVDAPYNPYQVVVRVEPQAPPPHPLPYDHGKYRVAEEPPGTNLYDPWRLDYCLECRLPTWTHNARVAAKHESLCESCGYLLFTELSETRVAKENRTQRGTYNPFDS